MFTGPHGGRREAMAPGGGPPDELRPIILLRPEIALSGGAYRAVAPPGRAFWLRPAPPRHQNARFGSVAALGAENPRILQAYANPLFFGHISQHSSIGELPLE